MTSSESSEDSKHFQDMVQALTTLANGIIPADDRDAGAAAVDAGPRLADRLRTGAGINAPLYADGLRRARELAAEMFGRDRAPADLTPADLHALLERLRTDAPGFFKQLRMDVSALYLSDPAVQRRIGFPGPAIETGGYPDFDQSQ
jgi:Gluconate 2-dehydrogenase subunit 3